MKKYSFLVYHKEYIDFLRGIQELGVLHVIEKESGEIKDEETRLKYQQLNELKNVIKFLEKRNIEDLETNGTGSNNALGIVQDVLKLQEDMEKYQQKLAHLKKDLSILEPWGEFSWKTIEKLSYAGNEVSFYSCPSRSFDPAWEETYQLFRINEDAGQELFIVVHSPDEEIDIDAEKVKLPRLSLSQLSKDFEEVEAILDKTEGIFDRAAKDSLELLKEAGERLSSELKFEEIVLGTQREAEEKVMFLEGWIPDEQSEEVAAYLGKMGIYYEEIKPEPGDNPPIKLKNNKFARLYESIGELYTFPNYNELDLTPFFAPFYMLFFGFCLGDAGYGLLITLGTIYGIFKASPKFKPLFKLGMFLGISTTVMGIIGGTFFGIMLHPDDFESARTLAPWLKSYQEYIVSSDNLMYIALGIGYLQVLFGMFLNAANRMRLYGFKYSISQLGWNIIVLVTIPTLGLSIMELIPAGIAKNIMIISLIIGGIPAFFYNTPGKNPLLNLGTGLWDTYQVASGLLGDVLSYIRLFALGLSSAILGNVFNQLAMQSYDGVGKGIPGVIVLIIILAFGHSLNFFMAALGSFVHPLRLTFVEFYKNAGFSGGGKKYEPFKK